MNVELNDVSMILELHVAYLKCRAIGTEPHVSAQYIINDKNITEMPVRLLILHVIIYSFIYF